MDVFKVKVVENCHLKIFGVDVRTPCTLGRKFLSEDSKIILENREFQLDIRFLNTLSPKSCCKNICQYLSCMGLSLCAPKGGNKTTGSISLKFARPVF